MDMRWLWADALSAINYNVCTPHGLFTDKVRIWEKEKCIHSPVVRTVNVTITGLPQLNLTFSPSKTLRDIYYPPTPHPTPQWSNRETWQLQLTTVMSDRLLPKPFHRWQMEARGFILLCILPTPCKMILCCDWQHSDCKGVRNECWGLVGRNEMQDEHTIPTRHDTGQPSVPWHLMRVVVFKYSDPRPPPPPPNLSRGNYETVNNLSQG